MIYKGKAVPKSRNALLKLFYDKHGFHAAQESCGDCGKSRRLHDNGFLACQFVPTGRKAQR